MEHPFDPMVTMKEFGHENVYFFNDEATHLQGVIAIHNTVLGPALGGTRLWNYANSFEALHDVLRLSRYDLQVIRCGYQLRGGKAAIMRHPEAKYDKAYWTRYGEFVERLGGNYITAADVGTKTEFIRHIASSTSSVAGKPDDLGGGGDPSPVTAYGVYLGMKASASAMVMMALRESESLFKVWDKWVATLLDTCLKKVQRLLLPISMKIASRKRRH